MRINQTGKIVDNLYLLGHISVHIYLLDVPVPVLFDAGISVLSRQYVKEIRKILGNRTPAYLFITHAHWDHVGAASYFKTVWPDIRIVGSPKTQEILGKPSAVRLIKDLNYDAAGMIGLDKTVTTHKVPFETFNLDETLTPGQIIELSPGYSIHAIHTPGHTWDFTSYWIPERKILIAAEAAGCDDGSGLISAEFLVDYDTYLNSLGYLAQLDLEVLCLGHAVALTGPDARRHLQHSFEHADNYVTMVEGFLRQEKGVIKRVVNRVKAIEWDPRPWPKQPEKPYLINTIVRVKIIWERMQKENSSC